MWLSFRWGTGVVASSSRTILLLLLLLQEGSSFPSNGGVVSPRLFRDGGHCFSTTTTARIRNVHQRRISKQHWLSSTTSERRCPEFSTATILFLGKSDPDDTNNSNNNVDDDNNLKDWDGIGDAMTSSSSIHRESSSEYSFIADAAPVSFPDSLGTTLDPQGPSEEKKYPRPDKTDSYTIRKDGYETPKFSSSRSRSSESPPIVTRKFTGSPRLFAEQQQQQPSLQPTTPEAFDSMFQQEMNLASLFEQTLPLQAALIAAALVFVIYTSLQEPNNAMMMMDSYASFDVMIDESLLPDYWSQFQGGGDSSAAVDIMENIGTASGESVFL